MKKFISISYLLFFSQIPCNLAQSTSVYAQDSQAQNNNARALFEASLDFLKQKIKDSGYALNAQDLESIKRTENTFSIPKRLRIKGLASLPIIQEQAVVRKIKYRVPKSAEALSGFSFASIQNASVLSKLGLQKDDILYKVNDEIVDDTDTATKIFNKVKQNDTIEVQIVRQNKIVLFRYLFV